ncbi:unnamed protein product [Heterobilharzia americana]|nr:unnamed protein product [Heterobilharzia americana]
MHSCITFRHVCVVASILPPLALVICVLWCLATSSCIATHCTDSNLLPSLSAAVGEDEPQKTIWRFSIFSSSAWRMLILVNSCMNFWTFFNSLSNGDYLHFAALLCLSSFVEIFALNMLTVWSSSDNFTQHRNYFCIFIMFSVIYMAADVYSTQLIVRDLHSVFLRNILKMKIRIFAVYLSCLLVIMLSYYIHITSCPPYVYTVFAVFEYVAIFSNVAYHYTAALIYEDISIGKMIGYFSTGRTIPFVDVKSGLPMYK